LKRADVLPFCVNNRGSAMDEESHPRLYRLNLCRWMSIIAMVWIVLGPSHTHNGQIRPRSVVCQQHSASGGWVDSKGPRTDGKGHARYHGEEKKNSCARVRRNTASSLNWNPTPSFSSTMRPCKSLRPVPQHQSIKERTIPDSLRVIKGTYRQKRVRNRFRSLTS
jgi:hypothetical protein